MSRLIYKMSGELTHRRVSHRAGLIRQALKHRALSLLQKIEGLHFIRFLWWLVSTAFFYCLILPTLNFMGTCIMFHDHNAMSPQNSKWDLNSKPRRHDDPQMKKLRKNSAVCTYEQIRKRLRCALLIQYVEDESSQQKIWPPSLRWFFWVPSTDVLVEK